MDYLKFIETEKKPKTNIYEVRSVLHDEYLGEIYWYTSWREYVFVPFGMVMSSQCARQMYDKLMYYNMQQRQGGHGSDNE